MKFHTPRLPKMLRAAASTLLLGGLSSTTFASHLMGGEMFIRHLSGSSYEVQLVQYRDTNSVPFSADMTYQIVAADASGNPTVLMAIDTLHLQPGYSTYPIQSSLMVLERGVYTDTIQLTAPNKYWVVTDECCRNGNIANMANPSTTSMLLMADVTVTGTSSNSSPLFIVPPMPFLAKNVPARYNPLPYDMDGDSLVWSLSTPRTAGLGSNLSLPVAGFTAPPATSGNPFALNPVTGAVSWTPSQSGFFAQSITVEKYRNGVKMGSTSRDFHYIVVPGTSADVPQLTVSSTGNPVQYDTAHDYYTVEYIPGVPFTMSISGTGSNVAPFINMDAYTALYAGPNPPQFSTVVQPTSLEGTFQWTPSVLYTQNTWVVVRMNNNQFASDVTIFLKANLNPPPASVTTPSAKTSAKLYPNPNDGSFRLALNLSAIETIKATIFNSIGQQITVLHEGIAGPQTILSSSEALAKGLYFVQIQRASGAAETVPFVVR